MVPDKEKRTLFEFLLTNKKIIIGILTMILIVVMLLFVDFLTLVNRIIAFGFAGTLSFIILYTLVFILRTYKLKLIFKGLGHEISFSTIYFSIGACFAINDLTPGKIGDLAKIFIIKDQSELDLGNSTAGVSIERVLDLILLFLISAFALVYLNIVHIDTTSEILVLGQGIQFYLIVGALLIFALLIFFLFIFYKTEFVLKIIRKISPKIASYLNRFLNSFKKGIKKFKENKKYFITTILLGFPTWIADACIIVLFFYFSGFPLNIFLLILASILLFFSKFFPITPGGWGISENIGAFFIIIFYPYFYYTDILSIFIMTHLFRSAYLLFFGGFSIFHYNIKLREIENLEVNNFENDIKNE
ncbi:MAG: flippase-like domain-containing protein [Candidatus Lokiarchaeota archaeon]|nr:flippase-like domain-containing protein [Candidatus Lokiarchaeota archaeon]MBD3199685.1 flippase-like domain-containing protein [Candidatus Lokiarchaeota archaeon]